MSDKQNIMDKMMEALRQADANDDGWMTKDELFNAIKSFKSTNEKFMVVEVFYANAEKNSGGEISYDKVLEWVFAEKGRTEGDRGETELHDSVSVGHVAQARAEATKLLKSLCLEETFAEAILFDTLLGGSWDDPLSGFFELTDAQVDALIIEAAMGGSLAQRIKKAVKDGSAASQALHTQGNAGSKFTGSLQGGDLKVYYGGVADIVGEPRDDIAKGVELEHMSMPDSEIAFTTSNYGITTTPKLEYELIANYSGEGGNDVVVTGTRRCSKQAWVPEADTRTIRPISYFEKLEVVQKASLMWIEILTVVLYTGPLFLLYNGILRGFGSCGEVDDGVIFWSDEFSEQFNSVSMRDRVERSGHRFPSTIHALASAVKKLQHLSSGVQGTMVYRGLGGLDVKSFIDGHGFTERAFTSTTQNLEVALEYSGAKKGKSGTVLAMELSEVDQGAELQEFSQYPGERETLWNACSYMEAFKGREEWKITPWGLVKLVFVKMNAASKASTVQELENRRKSIVVNMLETLSADIQREMPTFSVRFQERLRVDNCLIDNPGIEQFWTNEFLKKVSGGVEQRVGNLRDKTAAWFHDTKQFAQAVSSAASLPLLATSWVITYVEDEKASIRCYSRQTNFFESLRNECRLHRKLMEQGRCENDNAKIQRNAAAICILKGYVHDITAMEKDIVDGGQESPLVEKSREGDRLAVKLLLEAKADMESKAPCGIPALLAAAEAGQATTVQVLIDAGASLQVVDNTQCTALHFASKNGHKDAVQVLLAAGADVKSVDNLGCTALHFASDKNAVQALLAAGADVKAVDNSKCTALHFASKNSHKDVAQALLAADADVEAVGSSGRTALHFASENGHKGVVQALLAAGADVKASPPEEAPPRGSASPSEEAPPMGKGKGKKGKAPAPPMRQGRAVNRPALHFASGNGHKDVVQALLAAGADAKAVDNSGHTALYAASENGHEDAAQALLAAGADVNAVDNLKCTALYIASKNGHKVVVQALLAAGADVNTVTHMTSFGYIDRIWTHTALHHASANGHTDVVQALLAAGADIEAVGGSGRTALYIALLQGHKDCIQALLAAGADVKAVTAHPEASAELVDALLEARAELRKRHAHSLWLDNRS